MNSSTEWLDRYEELWTSYRDQNRLGWRGLPRDVFIRKARELISHPDAHPYMRLCLNNEIKYGVR